MKITGDEPELKIYHEACRMIGQCCLILASNGAETDRRELAYQLKRLAWEYIQVTDELHPSLLLAIEQLQEGLEDQSGG